MYSKMEMPRYSNMVRFVAQVGALFGVIFGLISFVGGFSAFKYGNFAAFSGMLAGIMTIVGSLASLGLVYCFLSLVEAQMDIRNAILSNLNIKSSEKTTSENNETIENRKEEHGHISSEVRLYD